MVTQQQQESAEQRQEQRQEQQAKPRRTAPPPKRPTVTLAVEPPVSGDGAAGGETKGKGGRPSKRMSTEEAKSFAGGTIDMLNGLVVLMLGPEAAMSPLERMLIEQPAIRLASRLPRQTVERVFSLADPVSLAIGLAMWSARIFQVASAKGEEARRQREAGLRRAMQAEGTVEPPPAPAPAPTAAPSSAQEHGQGEPEAESGTLQPDTVIVTPPPEIQRILNEPI